MINYLSEFSARLPELAEPLSKDKVPFNWGPEHQEAFKQMKKEIARAPLLWPKETNCPANRCKHKGQGSCLLKDDKLLYFGSKGLTEAPKGYMAIEIVSLVVAWDMEKFHYLLCASHFILETDQKPLEAILSKSLYQATPRLQRILIITFPTTSLCIISQVLQINLQIACPDYEVKRIQLNYLNSTYTQITNQLCARSDGLN